MPKPPPPPRRILIRGVNWLGDAVMTTPALLRLRERFPAAHITLLTPQKLAALWPEHPAVDEVVAFTPGASLWGVASALRDRPWQPYGARREQIIASGRAAYGEAVAQGGTLAQVVVRTWQRLQAEPPEKVTPTDQPFDLAIVLPNSPRSALEMWLARIPQRIGYGRLWRSCWLTHALARRPDAVPMRKRTASEVRRLVATAAKRPLPPRDEPPGIATRAHQIHEYLHLMASLGANPEPLHPALSVAPQEVAAAQAKFGLGNLPGPLLGLNPGAEYGPAKRWPATHFLEAAGEIHRRTRGYWLLLGGQGDTSLTAQIASGLREAGVPHLDLAGKTSLRELMALLKLCRVVLTNDTGPMHVAAAMGTPVVAIFGSTSPELTGPGMLGDPHHLFLKSSVPCSPCFLRQCPIDLRCLQSIGVSRVTAAMDAAIRW